MTDDNKIGGLSPSVPAVTETITAATVKVHDSYAKVNGEFSKREHEEGGGDQEKGIAENQKVKSPNNKQKGVAVTTERGVDGEIKHMEKVETSTKTKEISSDTNKDNFDKPMEDTHQHVIQGTHQKNLTQLSVLTKKSKSESIDDKAPPKKTVDQAIHGLPLKNISKNSHLQRGNKRFRRPPQQRSPKKTNDIELIAQPNNRTTETNGFVGFKHLFNNETNVAIEREGSHKPFMNLTYEASGNQDSMPKSNVNQEKKIKRNGFDHLIKQLEGLQSNSQPKIDLLTDDSESESYTFVSAESRVPSLAQKENGKKNDKFRNVDRLQGAGSDREKDNFRDNPTNGAQPEVMKLRCILYSNSILY